jgi:hypothetical protein
MVRATRHVGCLIAALVAAAGLRFTAAPAGEPLPSRAVSSVAQSTTGTAGTGRRPIAERIAASNLPVRALSAQAPLPPDNTDAPVPAETDVAPELTLPESDDSQPLEETAPEVAEYELEVVERVPEPAGPETAVVTLPTPIPAQPKPFDAFRGRLLHRIKGAFATRHRAGVDAVSPEGLAVSSSQPADRGAPQTKVADPTATEASPESPTTPARLEFDVHESRSLVGQGEEIVMSIAVRNVGGTTAQRVKATLFFADGIEPVQAIGHTADVLPGEVRFATFPELSPGSSVDLVVTAVGTQPGSVPYRGELACDQLAGLIAREGAVMVQPVRATLP